ncbi:MAG: phosphodiester glycosidase family protein [Actinomycetota bacterium]|nr:phosphodiester glycosidase family protein [Actinomycetota bacterium]
MSFITTSTPRHRISSEERKERSGGTPNYRRRRILVAIGSVFLVLALIIGPSLVSALTNPSLGSGLNARFAEWARTHGANGFVNWAENIWYSHHAPPVGGKPAAGALRVPTKTRASADPAAATVPVHLPAPAPIQPLATPALPGEGQWTPVGRLVGGIPAMYETRLRPDPIHTSLVVGVAWMDTKLLRATLYSGSFIPGGGPYRYTAPIGPNAATSLVAAFNAGFQLSASNGGYYTDGRLIAPLRNGAASFVVYANGSCTVGAWGQNVTMTPNVVSVRQNLDLLVNNGQPVPGLNANDTTQWGATLGDQVYVWRSGLGVTANGALVYVGGPGLNITTLADLLVRAGAVRAMEMDINTDWVNLTTYDPSTPNGAATPANGTMMLPNMTGGTSRYFATWWSRDFITMSARPVG